MRVRLTSAAHAELAAALTWYRGIRLDLGVRFLDEYEALLLRLRENPEQFPKVRDAVRRAGFRHFPYGLFYRVRTDTVEVIACFHARRHPRRWQDRI